MAGQRRVLVLPVANFPDDVPSREPIQHEHKCEPKQKTSCASLSLPSAKCCSGGPSWGFWNFDLGRSRYYNILLPSENVFGNLQAHGNYGSRVIAVMAGLG
jgi:hypothetical protein